MMKFGGEFGGVSAWLVDLMVITPWLPSQSYSYHSTPDLIYSFTEII